jgi:thymidine phosphorylase
MQLISKITYELRDADGVAVKFYSSTKATEVDDANAVDYLAELQAEAMGSIERTVEKDIAKALRELENPRINSEDETPDNF